jgi:hypothetical protein
MELFVLCSFIAAHELHWFTAAYQVCSPTLLHFNHVSALIAFVHFIFLWHVQASCLRYAFFNVFDCGPDPLSDKE